MEIITHESENSFSEFLAFIAEEPDLWMCVHINMAVIHEEMLDNEGLSRQSIEKMHGISDKIAKKICDMGLGQMEGRTFVFEDGDVASLFLCAHPSRTDTVEKLHNEFTSKNLGQLFHSYYMKDKLAGLITLSKEKISSAADFKSKQRTINRVDSIFELVEPDTVLTKMIQKKRNGRTSGVILVIEDDLITRGFIASALKKEYKVVQAKDGKTGIAAYMDNAPNIVLLDIHLPDHTGHEVLNRLMLLDPEAYVVMVSADSVTDNVRLAQTYGSVGFIRKPFLKENLLSYIKKCPTLGIDATAKALGWSNVFGPRKIS